jgi:hydroxyacylglutathione hydrolase
MKLLKLVVGLLKVNCYILASDSGAAVVIDPGDNPSGILRLLDENNLRLLKILLTHGHFDHVLAIPALKDATNAPYFVHEGDLFLIEIAHERGEAWTQKEFQPLPPPDGFLHDSDMIRFGDEELEVRHTPGHSPGGVSFVWHREKAVFTGDTLLYDTVGRSDFTGGNAQDLIRSIEKKLLSLPDDYVVYQGHGQPTSIGRERRENPFLVLASKGIVPRG